MRLKHTFARLQQIAASSMREGHTERGKYAVTAWKCVSNEYRRHYFCAACYAAHLAELRKASTTPSLFEGSSTYMDTLSLALKADFLAMSWSRVSATVGVRATRSLLQVTPLTGNCRGGTTGTWAKHDRDTSNFDRCSLCRSRPFRPYLPPFIFSWSYDHRSACYAAKATFRSLPIAIVTSSISGSSRLQSQCPDGTLRSVAMCSFDINFNVGVARLS